jgi:hypothetical protein
LNVGTDISLAHPLVLSGNHSLVSTISNETPGTTGTIQHVSYVKTAAVLTSLSAIPAADAFRPGISASDKSIHRQSELDLSKLARWPVPAGQKISTTTLANQAKYHQMVWLDHNGGWTVRYMHPSDTQMGNYYFPQTFAQSAVMLQLDFSPAEKEKLLVNYIQLGLDLYSYIKAGGKGWPPDGGHANGRKWPILFAGLMLGDQAMIDLFQKTGDYLYANGHSAGNIPADYIHFGEDGQTFHVAQADVDITNGPTWQPDERSAPNFPYTQALIGMPEWGIRHSTAPSRSDSSWSANYRTIGSAMPSWAGFAMAAYAMDAKELWNNEAFFDYVDRYMSIAKDGSDPFGYTVDRQKAGARPSGIVGAVYDTYRYLRADVNGDGVIRTSDALLALRYSLGLSVANTAWRSATATGDVDCDASVTSADALLILRKSLGMSMTGTGWCE